MQFAGLSYIAVLAAAAAGFAFGAAYYMTLGKRWMAALGKTAEELKQSKPATPFIVAALAQIAMAFMLAGALGHMGPEMLKPLNAVIGGVFMWFGFVLTTIAVNYAFQGAKPSLTVIDAGHWLGVLALQGLIIGLIGV